MIHLRLHKTKSKKQVHLKSGVAPNPKCYYEGVIYHCLKNSNPMELETLIELVIEEVIRDEVKFGAAEVGIGVWGYSVFSREVKDSISSLDSVLLEISDIKDSHS